MSNDFQRVVFRKWRENGWIIALFPELPSDIQGRYCDSYEQIGQHGGADYCGVVRHSTPASEAESASLKRELIAIRYKLKPIKRASSILHERRRQAARRSDE